MRMKVLGMLALAGLSLILTGCNSTRNTIQGYSVRSYKGSLPMSDYQYLNQDSYSVPNAAY